MMKLSLTTLLILGGSAVKVDHCIAETTADTYTYIEGICREYSSKVCYKADGTATVQDLVHGK